MAAGSHSPAPTPVHHYPGGENATAYRWAFTAWLVLFLGVLCLGLLNFLGIYIKKYWPGI